MHAIRRQTYLLNIKIGYLTLQTPTVVIKVWYVIGKEVWKWKNSSIRKSSLNLSKNPRFLRFKAKYITVTFFQIALFSGFLRALYRNFPAFATTLQFSLLKAGLKYLQSIERSDLKQIRSDQKSLFRWSWSDLRSLFK